MCPREAKHTASSVRLFFLSCFFFVVVVVVDIKHFFWDRKNSIRVSKLLMRPPLFTVQRFPLGMLLNYSAVQKKTKRKKKHAKLAQEGQMFFFFVAVVVFFFLE